jgi:uncharacterized tellurite resistance protein B-like protein
LGVFAVLVVFFFVCICFLGFFSGRRPLFGGASVVGLDLDSDGAGGARRDPRIAAVASLLVEVARADHALGLEERMQIEEAIREQWDLPVGAAGGGLKRDTSEYASRVAAAWERPARLRLIQRLREVAYADRRLVRHEQRLLERAAELLGLSPDDWSEPGTPAPPPADP